MTLSRLEQSAEAHSEALKELARTAYELLHTTRRYSATELNVLGDELTDILIELGGDEMEDEA